MKRLSAVESDHDGRRGVGGAETQLIRASPWWWTPMVAAVTLLTRQHQQEVIGHPGASPPQARTTVQQ